MKEYSINDAADELGVAHQSIREWVREGRIRFRRRDDGHRSVMISEKTLEELKLLKEAFDFDTRLLSVTLQIFARTPYLRDEMIEKARQEVS